MKTTFIYALCEPGTRTVRYIGMTVDLEKRFKEHLKLSTRKKTHLGAWLRSIVGSGQVPDMIKLSEVSLEDGPSEEIRYIKAARISLGVNLVNSTDGGEGCLNPSPELRAHRSVLMRGKKRTADWCKNISEGLLGHKLAPETKALLSAAVKAIWKDPAYRAKLSDTRATPRSVAIRSQAAKDRWKDPEYASGHSISMKEHWSDPARHAAHSAATKEGVNTLECRANQSAAQKIVQATPEARAAKKARMKAFWADPVFRAKTLAGQRAKRLEKKNSLLTNPQT